MGSNDTSNLKCVCSDQLRVTEVATDRQAIPAKSQPSFESSIRTSRCTYSFGSISSASASVSPMLSFADLAAKAETQTSECFGIKFLIGDPISEEKAISMSVAPITRDNMNKLVAHKQKSLSCETRDPNNEDRMKLRSSPKKKAAVKPSSSKQTKVSQVRRRSSLNSKKMSSAGCMRKLLHLIARRKLLHLCHHLPKT